MINKRASFVVDFHPAAFNYNSAIKESSPLAANSEGLQKKLPEPPVIFLQLQQLPNLYQGLWRAILKKLGYQFWLLLTAKVVWGGFFFPQEYLCNNVNN